MARTTVRGSQIRDDSVEIIDLSEFAITAGTGLNVNFHAGRVRNNTTVTDVSAGSLLLSNNTTSYIEVDSAGTVSANTTGFTVGQIPLASVVTSGGAISTISDKRTWLPSSLGTETTRKPYHGIESFGALSFDNSTKALTVASGANTYWYKGTKYTTAAAIVCDLDLTADRDNSSNTLTTNKLYYFYFKDATGKLYWSDSSWNFFNNVFVATVFWNGSAGACQRETHNHTRDIDWHIWAHDTIGTRYESGLTLTNPTTVNDALLQIETGNIHDEDIDFATGQMTTMRCWHKASASIYTFLDYSLPYCGTSGAPRYLRTTDYTLQPVGATNFAVYWIYVSLDVSRPLHVVPTHAAVVYNSLVSARLETAPNLLGLNINSEMKLIYKFIFKGDGEFQESVDYRSSSPVPGGGTSTLTAGAVSVVPAGNIAATNVQAALEELDAEKAAVAQTMYLGTTSIPINRASAELTVAGVNINGTVGATTPTTGKFTTVELNATSGHIIGGDGTISPYNVITNGSFETWTGLTDLLTDGGLETWTNPWLRSNASIDDEDMADITDWTDNDQGTSASTQVTFDSKSCMKLDSGTAGGGNFAHRYQDIGSAGASTCLSMNLYFSALGTYANSDNFIWALSDGTHQCAVTIASDGLYVANAAGTNVAIGTNPVVQGVWQEWSFVITWGVSATVAIYLNGALFASGVDCASDSAGLNGMVQFRQNGTTTANRITYIDWFKAGSDFTQPLTNWTFYGPLGTCTQETTIKKVGTYSAKVTRNGTDCLLFQDFQNGGGRNLAYWKGRTVTSGTWVWASVATRARIRVVDGIGAYLSSFHTGDSTWQYLTVTHSIDNAATALQTWCEVLNGNTTAYFDSAICYEQLAPTGWTLSGTGATVAREESTIKVGTYSAKLTNATSTVAHLSNNDYADFAGLGTNYWKGRTVTLGAWVYASVASRVRLEIYDGVGATGKSSNHSGTPGWEYLTVTQTISASATRLSFYMYVDVGAITTAYFDGVTVNGGYMPFAFSEPPILQNSDKTVTLPGALITPNIGTPSAGVVTNLTGTASININGTVGATTPATGKFTTVELNATSGHIIGGDGTISPYNVLSNGSFETFTEGIQSPSTTLLLHMDGANDGTSFIDSSSRANVVTRVNAVTKTGVKKFGTASGYFNGTTDYLTVPSDQKLTNGSFETWTGLTDLLTDGGLETWTNPWLRSNASIDDEDMADITDWTDIDAINGVSTQATFDSKSCMKLDSGAVAAGSYAARQQDIGSMGASTVFSMNLYFDALGTVANNDSSLFRAFDGTHALAVRFSSNGLYVENSSGVATAIGTNPVVQDVWQEWMFKVTWGASATVDIYLNGELFAAGVDCASNDATANGMVQFIQAGYTTANRITYVDWFKAGSDFTQPLTNWTLFKDTTNYPTLDRESTIIKVGTYSAKIAYASGSEQGGIQSSNNTTAYRNKYMVAGCWVKCSVVGRAKIVYLHSGTGATLSIGTNTTTDWEYITSSGLVPNDATTQHIRLYLSTSVAVTAYFDSVICYEQLAPTGWTLAGTGATVAREESTIKVGTYSAKLTRNGADCFLYQDLGSPTGYIGKSVTKGMWVYASGSYANKVYISIQTDAGSSPNTYHSSSAGWEYITVTYVIPVGASLIRIQEGIVTNDQSAYFDGAFVTDDAAANFNFGSGDFTIDTWVNFDSLATRRTIVSVWDAGTLGPSQRSWLLEYRPDVTRIDFQYSLAHTDALIVSSSAWTPTLNTWYHIEVSRSGNTLYIFLNGVIVGTADFTGITIIGADAKCCIGRPNLTIGSTYLFSGYIDELRISKGIARHTSTFTPSTIAYGNTPTGWTLAGANAEVDIDTSVVKVGTYSAKLTRGGANCNLYQTIHGTLGINYWKGRTVTLGCWVWASVADKARLAIVDGVDTSVSSYHNGDSTWRYLTVTHTINNLASYVNIQLYVVTTDTTAYFDGAMVNGGYMPFAFSEPPVLLASDKSVTVPTSLTATLGDITAVNGNFKPSTTGKGIDFSATTDAAGMTSELLNDYEEGTWTPGIAFNGGTTGITYATQAGYYTKIGNLVHVSGYIALSAKGSSTGDAVITGLPFQIVNNAGAWSCPSMVPSTITFANQFLGRGSVGTAAITLLEVTEGGALGVISNTDFANNSTIMLSFAYRT